MRGLMSLSREGLAQQVKPLLGFQGTTWAPQGQSAACGRMICNELSHSRLGNGLGNSCATLGTTEWAQQSCLTKVPSTLHW